MSLAGSAVISPLKTPLFDAHVRWGARMVEFGGWQMPVFYSSILEEHQAVRTGAGLFDISHMGEFVVEGPAPPPGSTLSSPTTWRSSRWERGSTP